MDNNPINQIQHTQIYHVKNERMGGTVPSYDVPRDANIIQDTSNIVSAYRPQSQDINPALNIEQEPDFGFFDLLDMVNPLQHIPLVNLAYREITGDEIKPISMIVGGGIFGGPAGAASGIVNTIIQEETGQDILGNATSFAGLRSEQGKTDEHIAYNDLSASLLGFAALPIHNEMNVAHNADHKQTEERKDRVAFADNRTAGTIAVYG